MDSGPVTTSSSYVGPGNIGNVKRWSGKEKAHIEVPGPDNIQHYTRFLGGVDLLDLLIALYRISLRTKQWNVKMIFHFVEVGLANSWLEYVRASDVNNIPKKKIGFACISHGSCRSTHFCCWPCC